MKKILVPGLVSGLVMVVVSIIVSQVLHAVFPSVMAEYQNSGIFRPWTDPKMSIMFLHPFILGVILAYIWDKTKSVVKGNSPVMKGLTFGFIYWLLTIPGMVMSYSSFPISMLMVDTWIISIFIQSICGAIILALMNKA